MQVSVLIHHKRERKLAFVIEFSEDFDQFVDGSVHLEIVRELGGIEHVKIVLQLVISKQFTVPVVYISACAGQGYFLFDLYKNEGKYQLRR